MLRGKLSSGFRILLPMAILVIAVSACSTAPTPATSSTTEPTATVESATETEEPEPVGRPSGTLTWALTNDVLGYSLNDTNAHLAYDTMCDTLVQYDPESYTAGPRLAESWEVNDDGSVWTFKLRENVRFHDGEPLTSEDVKFSYEAVMNPDNNANYHRGNLADVASIETIDEFTVVINLSRPNFEFISLLGDHMHIFPKHLLEGQDLRTPAEFIENPVCSGPFKFFENIPGEGYVQVANEDYWKGPPKLERIIYKVIPDVNVQVAQLLTGELDVSERIGPSHVAALEFSPQVQVYKPTAIGYWHIFFNDTTPYLEDVRVRQALHYAFDRQQVVDNILLGVGSLAAGPIGPAYGRFHNPSLEAYPFDQDKAQELLDEAGWQDTDGDGILDKDIDGDGIRDPWAVEIIVTPFFSEWLDIALVVQQQWNAVGLDVSLRPMEGAAGFDLVFNDSFTMIMGARGTPAPSPIDVRRYFGCNAPGNWFHYCNEEVDGLIDRAQASASEDERIELYHEAARLLLEDPPSLIYWYRADLQAVSSRVTGWIDAEVRFNRANIHAIGKDG